MYLDTLRLFDSWYINIKIYNVNPFINFFLTNWICSEMENYRIRSSNQMNILPSPPQCICIYMQHNLWGILLESIRNEYTCKMDVWVYIFHTATTINLLVYRYIPLINCIVNSFFFFFYTDTAEKTTVVLKHIYCLFVLYTSSWFYIKAQSI